MVKANLLYELLGLDSLLYKDLDIFYVKYPNGKIEKHYYRVSEAGKVLVNVKETEQLKDPFIKGEGINYDSKTKKNIYKWQMGEEYAVPLYSIEDVLRKPLLTDNDVNQLFDAGREFERLTTELPAKESTGNMPLMLIIIIILLAINAFITYRIADHFGIMQQILSSLTGGGA